MASAQRFTCDSCDHEIIAWSDGNPYYFDESGQKQYAYHPDSEGLARCIGNDDPHLCLSCAAEFNVDSENPTKTCPKCVLKKIKSTTDLENCRCPFCKAGKFHADEDYCCIS